MSGIGDTSLQISAQTLSCRLVCVVLNYQRLDRSALDSLEAANLKTDCDSLNSLRYDLGFEIDSFAVIKKCNAVLILAAYHDNLAREHVRGRMLTAWDRHATRGVTRLVRDIRFYFDADVLSFLAESAVGIHSVTVGDSQVLSQLQSGLKNNCVGNQKNSFSLIAEWLGSIAEECRTKTAIFTGNTSLERIACETLLPMISPDDPVLVVGFGRSGKLVSKILSRENGRSIVIANRTLVSDAEERLPSPTTFTSLTDIPDIQNFKGVIIALEHTPATSARVQALLENLCSTAVVVDLSTPPFKPSAMNYRIHVDITDLSKKASSAVNLRRNEVAKARAIIAKKLTDIIDVLNRNDASLYISEQKSRGLILSAEKTQLIEIRGEMLRSIRKLLEEKEFTEVLTPYIVGISTDPPKVDDGGALEVDWMNGVSAFLRQSNQIYKQVCVAGGIPRLYEIGPFWRREKYESYRHLQESIGLDIEFQHPESLEQLYHLAYEVICETNKRMIASLGLDSYLEIPERNRIPIITYHQAVDLLRTNGVPATRGDDLGLVNEAKLGEIIKNEHGSDMFVIKDYPDTIKKFYTKDKGEGLTETFDIIVGGWELVSGAIRQTDGEKIRKSMQLSGINASEYEFYISIIDGAIPHGGFCIGLDRLLAKIMHKEMVSDAVPFPRTYKNLIP